MKHSNGEGSIYKRQDGRWAASLMVTGKRHTVYARTRQEAAEKLRRLQGLAQRAGFLPDPGKLTVGDLLSTWLETAAPILKRRSLQSYQQVCDQRIRPVIGGCVSHASHRRPSSASLRRCSCIR